MSSKKRVYGWHPSRPDHRDEKHKYAAKLMRARLLPKSVDLRAHDNPIYDQGDLGSCVGNGSGDAWQFALKVEGRPAPLPSRLFVYYNGRSIENTIKSDSGLQIRDGLKALAKWGCCDETIWPYDPSKFTQKPPAIAYTEAAKHISTSYHSVNQNLNEMKTCLADGFPIVGGFTVYDSFESDEVAKTGIVPMPGKDENSQGGHCVVIVGYDDARSCFIIRNSWGTDWADHGYCYMPYDYWTNPNLASDFWTVRAVN